MKNKNFLIVGLAILGVGILAYFFLNKGKVSNQQQSTKTTTEKEEKSFTGSLKEAIALGIAMKCSYEIDGVEYEGYIKGSNYSGKVYSNGKAGAVILKDNCMWSWDDDTKKGVKSCYDLEGEDETIWDSEDTTAVSTDYTYRCAPSAVSDAMFTPPSDVEFMDVDTIMQDMPENMQEYINDYQQ